MNAADSGVVYLSLGISLSAVGAIFLGVSGKPGFGPIGFALLAIGLVHIILYGVKQRQ